MNELARSVHHAMGCQRKARSDLVALSTEGWWSLNVSQPALRRMLGGEGEELLFRKSRSDESGPITAGGTKSSQRHEKKQNGRLPCL